MRKAVRRLWQERQIILPKRGVEDLEEIDISWVSGPVELRPYDGSTVRVTEYPSTHWKRASGFGCGLRRKTTDPLEQGEERVRHGGQPWKASGGRIAKKRRPPIWKMYAVPMYREISMFPILPVRMFPFLHLGKSDSGECLRGRPEARLCFR